MLSAISRLLGQYSWLHHSRGFDSKADAIVLWYNFGILTHYSCPRLLVPLADELQRQLVVQPLANGARSPESSRQHASFPQVPRYCDSRGIPAI